MLDSWVEYWLDGFRVMKLLSGLFTLVFVFTFLLSSAFAQDSDQVAPVIENMESAESATSTPPLGDVDVASMFWPIVPGTTVADGTFFFKQLKESLTGMMKFGNIEQAKYNTELSKKRIVEANKLVGDENYDAAIKSLLLSDEKRKLAIEAKRKAAEAGENTVEIANIMVDAFNKEKQVLEYFSIAMPADRKAPVDAQLQNIELQISEAK